VGPVRAAQLSGVTQVYTKSILVGYSGPDFPRQEVR
jgi:hypothetical protein